MFLETQEGLLWSDLPATQEGLLSIWPKNKNIDILKYFAPDGRERF